MPRVREGWVRLLPGAMAMQAGFGRIDNPCPMPATIVAARSPAYASVALHESRLVDGIHRMRAVPALRIAPDGAALLKPGGLHLMLMQPRVPLPPGSRVAIEFTLADGRVLRGEFVARKPVD
jgi:copper(I)-binding protein